MALRAALWEDRLTAGGGGALDQGGDPAVVVISFDNGALRLWPRRTSPPPVRHDMRGEVLGPRAW